MAERLKAVLPNLISNRQNAFLNGRSIAENILLMHDIVRGYHINEGKAGCAIKVDLMKAYDTVS